MNNKHYVWGFVAIIFIFALFGCFIIATYTNPYEFDVEADCTLGNLKTDFQGNWQYWNETKDIGTSPMNVNLEHNGEEFIMVGVSPENITWTSEITQKEKFFPEYLKFNGLEDVHCNFKVKGQVPLKLIEVMIPNE